MTIDERLREIREYTEMLSRNVRSVDEHTYAKDMTLVLAVLDKTEEEKRLLRERLAHLEGGIRSVIGGSDHDAGAGAGAESDR